MRTLSSVALKVPLGRLSLPIWMLDGLFDCGDIFQSKFTGETGSRLGLSPSTLLNRPDLILSYTHIEARHQ